LDKQFGILLFHKKFEIFVSTIYLTYFALDLICLTESRRPNKLEMKFIASLNYNGSCLPNKGKLVEVFYLALNNIVQAPSTLCPPPHTCRFTEIDILNCSHTRRSRRDIPDLVRDGSFSWFTFREILQGTFLQSVRSRRSASEMDEILPHPQLSIKFVLQAELPLVNRTSVTLTEQKHLDHIMDDVYFNISTTIERGYFNRTVNNIPAFVEPADDPEIESKFVNLECVTGEMEKHTKLSNICCK